MPYSIGQILGYVDKRKIVLISIKNTNTTGARVTLILLFALLIGIVIFTHYRDDSELNRVLSKGELVIATRNSPTTYYIGPDGPTGFDYDLARAFADHLGINLTVVLPERLGDILDQVSTRQVDFAAAGLTITESRKRHMIFGPVLEEVNEQVVYLKGAKKPGKIRDLVGLNLEVLADSSHAERLGELHHQYPDLTWVEQPEMDTQELLQLVAEKVIDVTIADSNEVKLIRRYNPDLRVGFNFSGSKQIAWAFPKSDDLSLYYAARDFLENAKKSGLIQQIQERYYGTTRRLNYVGTQIYMRHILKRLPEYRDLFEEAGAVNNIDWRLIAAVGYQESQWDPKAKSPTGVRGLMMLTQNTAKELGIDDRLDPAKSIEGGARYLNKLREKIPERIPEPDRTWMALASYNIGYGHLEDARKITQSLGGDPDRWIDVMEHLPLLMKKKYYKYTRFGYARGGEAKHYVQNIRNYYDILIWMTDKEKTIRETEVPAFGILPPSL